MAKAFINGVEFYITNVCNYNCVDCNRLNNYYFSGHQYWKDYADTYSEWSKKLDIKNIGILGGEPLLNPSLPDWLVGLRTLWPDSNIVILTNGTRLDYWDQLYNILNQYNISLSIQLHARTRYHDMVNELDSWLCGPVHKEYKSFAKTKNLWKSAYQSIKDESWPDCNSLDQFESLPEWIREECTVVHKIDPVNYLQNTGELQYVDANGVKVKLQYSEDHWSAPLRREGDSFKVYNSDPALAHKVCPSKLCHNFVRGKLYKCHHVALLPEFMQQFDVDISAEDQDLLMSYQSIDVDFSVEDMQRSINNLKQQIPQCKICPSSLEMTHIQSSTDKPKIIKIKKV